MSSSSTRYSPSEDEDSSSIEASPMYYSEPAIERPSSSSGSECSSATCSKRIVRQLTLCEEGRGKTLKEAVRIHCEMLKSRAHSKERYAERLQALQAQERCLAAEEMRAQGKATPPASAVLSPDEESRGQFRAVRSAPAVLAPLKRPRNLEALSADGSTREVTHPFCVD